MRGKTLHVTFGDARDADWAVATPSVPFIPSSADGGFDVTLRVVGAAVQVELDGVPYHSYGTATGLPLEGHVGFYVAQGAVRFLRPRFARLPGARSLAITADDGTLTPPAAWNGRRAIALSTLAHLPLLAEAENEAQRCQRTLDP